MRRYLFLAVLPFALLMACGGGGGRGDTPPVISPPPGGGTPPPVETVKPFIATEYARFNEPWAMNFLPNGKLLVTEKAGKLKLFDVASRQSTDVAGVPAVAYGGQGGLGDIVLHPQFVSNGLVYFSYAEAGTSLTPSRGAAVARAQLQFNAAGVGSLNNTQVIWRQAPKVDGEGHYSHRLLFAPDGSLFITSGDRQKLTPAQDMQSNLGKLIHLKDDGTLPADNPFLAQGDLAAQVWTLGHRNMLGIAYDLQGRLWVNEMGPKGGDELNLISRGDNYGWPTVSEGDHYDGAPIPRHSTRPEYHAPAISWTPVISPSSLIFYNGTLFPAWRGDALIGGLSSQALVRVRLSGATNTPTATEVGRYDMGQRLRAVRQGPDGAVWLLEDGRNGRLLKLTPSGG